MDEAAVTRLIAYTRAQGGGTFDRDTLEPVTSINCHHGYAVAVRQGNALFTSYVGDTIETLTHDIRAVVDTWKGAPYIGTWVVGTELFIDPVVIVHDYFDAFTIARALGQKAVYSFGERKVLDV